MSVYFIRVGRYFKIGTTEDVEQRFANLHRSGTRYTFPADAPVAIEDRELYKVIPGFLATERSVHAALEDFAVGLEWFVDEPPLRAFVDALPTDGSVGDLTKVERDGGHCAADYLAVQEGRANREWRRYIAAKANVSKVRGRS